LYQQEIVSTENVELSQYNSTHPSSALVEMGNVVDAEESRVNPGELPP
jgi:DNA-directed RNA polymerase subunit L